MATLTNLFKSGSNNAVISASNDVHPHVNSVQRCMLKQHISRSGKPQLNSLHYLQRKKQVVKFFDEVFGLSQLKEGRDAPSMLDNDEVKTALYNVINFDECCKRENDVFFQIRKNDSSFQEENKVNYMQLRNKNIMRLLHIPVKSDNGRRTGWIDDSLLSVYSHMLNVYLGNSLLECRSGVVYLLSPTNIADVIIDLKF